MSCLLGNLFFSFKNCNDKQLFMKKSAAIKIFLNKAKNKIILICTDKTKKKLVIQLKAV